MKKNMFIIVGVCVAMLTIVSLAFIFSHKKSNNEYDSYVMMDNTYLNYRYITSFDEYEKYLNTLDEYYEVDKSILDEIKKGGTYLVYSIEVDSCNESIKFKDLIYENSRYKLYYDITSHCGVCAPLNYVYVSKVDHINTPLDVYYKVVAKEQCSPYVVKKPMIYIYPTDTIDLKVYLNNTDILLHAYPKYNGEWNLRVDKDGNIYDYNTERNYYALYWDAVDNTELNESEGFVVEGSRTTEFLEEKLEILGLTEREINEFIVYWIDSMENNTYNFIHFRTIDEINEYMPLSFDKTPDTLIRVVMDFKPLNEYKEVKEQKLIRVKRKGFTVVEWGGCEH